MHAMRKVLVLTPEFPPHPRVGTIKRIMSFIRYLPAFEWEPVILTMDWGQGPKSQWDRSPVYATPNLAKASLKAYHAAEMDTAETLPARFRRCIFSFLRSAKKYILIPDELILWLPWIIPRSRHIMKKDTPGIILVSGPPFSPLLIGVVLKRIHHIPLVCDIRDDWGGNPLIEKTSPLLSRLEMLLERWMVRNADKIVLVTPSSYQHWTGRYPEFQRKFVLIPNGYSEEEMASTPPFRFEDFAVVHVGSLEPGRSPEPLFQALARLKADEMPVHFYEYGIVIRKYRELAQRLDLSSLVHFEGSVPADEAIARIKGASLLVLIPTENAPTAIPGKAYEYLRSGKPVLLISHPNATTDFLGRFTEVYRVAPGDVSACAHVIRKIYSERPYVTSEQRLLELRSFERRKLTGDLALSLAAVIEDARC